MPILSGFFGFFSLVKNVPKTCHLSKILPIFAIFLIFSHKFLKTKLKVFDTITFLAQNWQGAFHQNFEKWKGIVWDSNSFISKTLLCSEPFPLHYTLCLCCAIQSKNSHHINTKGNAIIPMVIAKTAIITSNTMIRLSVIMYLSFYSFFAIIFVWKIGSHYSSIYKFAFFCNIHQDRMNREP